MNPLQILRSVTSQPAPIRYLIGLIAWRTGWGSWYQFRFRSFRLRLFPSNLSWQMWLNPRQFSSDLDLLAKILPSGGTMIDVGANVGHFALEATSVTGPQGKVIAFEPHPRVFHFLEENLKLNPDLKITAFQMALSDRTGEIVMEDGTRDDMNSLVNDKNDHHPRVTVPTSTLDVVLAGSSGRIDLLKIDVEGAEMLVLQGACQTLARSEAIMIEAGDLNTVKFGATAKDILTFLHSQDFHVRATSGSRLEPDPKDFVDHVGNWLALRDCGRFAAVLGAC